MIGVLIGDAGMCWSILITIGSLIVLITGIILLWDNIAKRVRRKRWNTIGQDVVLLHVLPRAKFTPSMSPFNVKLESFLRFAKIKYQVDTEEPLGPAGKTPWITLNGEEITDSQVIIDTLIKHFGLDYKLNGEQQAITTAFIRMLDHHTNWGLRVWRYKIDNGAGFNELQGNRPLLHRLYTPIIIQRTNTALWHHGIGRLSFSEVQQMVRQDYKAITAYLGNKKFMFGDEIGLLDSMIFGHLANLIYNYKRSPFYTIITEEMPELVSYVDRVKNILWPDWEQHLDK